MKRWIQAARLRTLPLSLSGIILGGAYAKYQDVFSWDIFLLSVLTTLGLQVLSNFANDYGDGIKGTDNENRVGPQRAIQSGAISLYEMKNGIILTAVLTFIAALALIFVSFGADKFLYTILFLILGVAAIVAALKYTIGNNAYGYRGLGDLFVFIFFGLVSTIGSFFLYSQQIDTWLWLPAISIGLLSVGVLNLNNMRDEASDKLSGKNTLVVKIGGDAAKKYHRLIVVVAMMLVIIFSYLENFSFGMKSYLLAFFPLIMHLNRVAKITNPRDLDPELKKLSLSTFLLSLLLAISLALV